jgi:hypothetical protein
VPGELPVSEPVVPKPQDRLDPADTLRAPPAVDAPATSNGLAEATANRPSESASIDSQRETGS